jgi:hypothetical protein
MMVANIFKTFFQSQNSILYNKSWHGVKILQAMIEKNKVSTCYMMMWHVNPHHITLGLHDIHCSTFEEL